MWQRFRKWLNIDHVVDICVDLFLILFDVITSPILIVMRLMRWTVGKYFLDGVKNKIKRLIYWLKNKPIWVSIIAIPIMLVMTFYLLVFMWLIGQAFSELIMETWGN